MIDFNEAFKKIDKWCKEHITCPIHAEFSSLRIEVRASDKGILLLDNDHFNGSTSGFTCDGKDWRVKYTGEILSEEHLLPSFRARMIETLVRNWHSTVKNRLINLNQAETALECFEA